MQIRRRIELRCNIGEQNHELVAALPADGVGLTHRTHPRSGNRFQYEIAGSVTECVIDLLEIIQIEKQDRQPRPVPTCEG